MNDIHAPANTAARRSQRFWDPHGPLGVSVASAVIALTTVAPTAQAFCGFYVAKADAQLYNEASQVVLVRQGDRTVLTMGSDYEGDPSEFALVVPVPTFLEREQIHVAEQALIDHLDAFSAPRLVEYYDEDPCAMRERRELSMAMDMAAPSAQSAAAEKDGYGVQIEATYAVGEYDILILSAEESNGLERWLRDNGYRIPRGASEVLDSYLAQKMRFFVAKVNLKEQAARGLQNLRPLQIAFESPKFMLPLRLGTVNAKGPQELLVYAITSKGRVEPTNYRTVRVPTDLDIPLYVRDQFADFYRDMFDHQVAKHGMRTVFLEHAWDMGWCDPCASEPLTRDELEELGVFWLDGDGGRGRGTGVFLTRLHVRYDREHFPEDLVFQETGNQEMFQGRYIMRHAWEGEARCAEARSYREQLYQRKLDEAHNLAELTGWDLAEIQESMDFQRYSDQEDGPWWRRVWER